MMALSLMLRERIVSTCPKFITVAVLLVLTTSFSFAQDHTPYSEQQQAIKSPNAVARMGTDLFGDEINLYQGTVTFRQTDIALRGNSELPVRVGRRLVAGNFSYTSHQFAFGSWQLDLPYLYG